MNLTWMMNYEIPAIIIGEPDRANFRAVHKALTPFSMDNTGNLYESGLKLASDISFTSGSWHSVNSLYNYLNLYQSKPGRLAANQAKQNFCSTPLWELVWHLDQLTNTLDHQKSDVVVMGAWSNFFWEHLIRKVASILAENFKIENR